MQMTHGIHYIFMIILRQYWIKCGTCPSNCNISQNCTDEDSGCQECDQAYYGRQCQHRIECRHTLQGAEYRGTLNTTIPGQVCQRWDLQTPHQHILNFEANYCRNPSGDSKPWCYTTDPDVRWQYCYVPICDTQCLAPRLDAPFVDIVNPPSSGFNIGFVAVLGCVVGYEHNGTSTTTCMANKTWSTYTYPLCSAKNCPSPDLNPNLTISISKSVYRHPDVIVFVCDSGYTLQGQSQLTCQANKTWNHALPTCQVKNCPSPDLNPNLKINITKSVYRHLDVIGFVCDSGYTLRGQSQLTCQANKTWNHALPTCQVNECPSPIVSPNSRVVDVKSVFHYRDKVTITCNTGYTLQGSPELTCQANKTWDHLVPTCKVIVCPLPDVTDANLIVNVHGSMSFNSVITFTCKSGYVLSRENALYCQEDEQWSDVIPSCVEAERVFTTLQVVGLCTGAGVISTTVLAIFILTLYRWKKRKRRQQVDQNTINETHYFEDIIASEIEEPHIYSTITDVT